MPDNFGERLKKLRKKAGLTQEQLAEMLNINHNSVSRWETDDLTPNARNIKALAKALGVSETDLLNEPVSDSQEWIINIKTAQNFTEEVIDLSGNVQPITSILQTPQGVAFTVQANWKKLDSINGLKKLFKEIEKVYPAIRQGGVELGGLDA